MIQAAQSRERASRAAISTAKAEFLPRIDTRTQAGYFAVDPTSNALHTREVRGEVSVSVPIVDGGLRQARLGEAREANESDWRLIEQAERETRASVAAAWNQLAAARASLGSFLNAVEAARRAYEGSRLQERAGVRTTFDVLDLARDLLTVQNNYNSAVANEYIARANLLSAMGRLEAPKLIAIPAYDPTAHFRKVEHNSDPPLITSVLSALDNLVIGPVKRDRPNRDPAATVATPATVALLPDSRTAPVDAAADR
jgi:outer membrane protein/S-layer protein transport system outer membrane protein